MGGREPDAQFFLQQIQRKGQRHGICAAGEGTDNMVPFGDHIIFADTGKELIQHVSTPGP